MELDRLKKEVESHSSALTNQLIHEVKKSVVTTGFAAMTEKPSVRERISFFSAVIEYYLETKDIYEEEDLQMIETQIKEGNKLASDLRKGHITIGKLENLLQISLVLQSMINTSLQRKSYFFRMGKPPVRGLDAALKIFEANHERAA